MSSWPIPSIVAGAGGTGGAGGLLSGNGGVGGEGADACSGFVLGVFYVEDRDWGWEGFFGASGGAVLGFDGAAALALGEHVLRWHGGPAFVVGRG